MKKQMILTLVLIFLLAGFASAAEKPLFEWSGKGMKNTEIFEIKEKSWRLVWDVSNEVFTGSGMLQVYLYTDKGNLLSLPINQLGTGKGETWIHNQRGKFYLEILSGNCDWKIEIFKK